jgi:hypothetical protein
MGGNGFLEKKRKNGCADVWRTGVNVMITILGDFNQFSAKNFVFFFEKAIEKTT